MLDDVHVPRGSGSACARTQRFTAGEYRRGEFENQGSHNLVTCKDLLVARWVALARGARSLGYASRQGPMCSWRGSPKTLGVTLKADRTPPLACECQRFLYVYLLL